MPRFFWIWLCLSTGCATVRTTGSFIEHPAPRQMQALARDAAHELAQLYPPSHTQLSFAHPTTDAFGGSFTTELRSFGFAVAEARTRGSQLAISYAVDEVAQLYRVVVRVASAKHRTTLARAYLHRDGAVRAAGAWTQQGMP